MPAVHHAGVAGFNSLYLKTRLSADVPLEPVMFLLGVTSKDHYNLDEQLYTENSFLDCKVNDFSEVEDCETTQCISMGAETVSVYMMERMAATLQMMMEISERRWTQVSQHLNVGSSVGGPGIMFYFFFLPSSADVHPFIPTPTRLFFTQV